MPGVTATKVTPALLIPAVVSVTPYNSVRPLCFSHRMWSCANKYENVSINVHLY